MRAYKNILIFSFLITVLFSSCKVQKTPGESLPYIPWNPGGNEETKNTEFYESLMDGLKEELINYNFEAALHYYENCLRLRPDDPTVLYKLGQIYFKAGRISESVASLKKAFEIDPSNYWIGHALADIYQQNNDFENAELVFEKMVKIFPDNISLKKDLAFAYYNSGKLMKSVKVLDDIEKIVGITEEITEQKKVIYLNLKKFDKAVEELQKLINANPENTDYIRKLIDLYVAYNKDDKVFDLYQRIIEINPNDPTAQLIVADYYLRWNRRDEGLKLAEKALGNPYLDLQSKVTFLMLNFLNKGIKEENRDIILKFSDLLVATHPSDSRVYSFRGDVKTALKMENEALDDYIRALQDEKNIAVLWNTVIVGLIKRGNYTDALAYSQEALEHFPLNPELYLYAGMCHLRLKEFAKAAEILESGLIYVKNNDLLAYQFYANLGEAFNGTKDYEKSDNYFDKALKIDNQDLSLLNNYAYYLSLRREKLDKAAEMSLKTLEKEPQNPAYLDTYGWILFLQNDLNNAKIYIEKALEKKSWDAEILEHYGDVLYKLGDTENALKYWLRAKEKGSLSEQLDKKIAGKKYYE
ncbi:MAG TPA: tetratricopeptide repeat protein [Bacteroidia bacterium]|nr:tetratricopeptide repeat protein [Bacteroidia bacterium]HRS57599.1 tetratricopeptide repeat protein [Bacteroidia bacterium]HRU67185.1 tetratricopeptide repeat protein [Bacteroidia bacterium]